MRIRFRAPDLVCQQVVELVTDYLEGSLSARDKRRFERHLAACDGCDAYIEQIRVTIAVSGQVTPEDLDERAVDELLGLFEAYRNEGEQPDQSDER